MIKTIKSKIISSIKNKRINVFLLFFLLSFVILIFTKLSKQYTKTLTFNIEKVNVPQEYVILNDSLKLNITLKTHGFKWLKYYVSEPKIDIDFTKDVQKKESVFVWNKSKAYLKNTQFPNDVELLNLSPDTLKFRYGVNMVKKVPVTVHTDIKYDLGYDLEGKISIEPDSVVVVGPNILVSQIKGLETETLVLTDVRSNIDNPVKLKLPDNTSDLNFSVEEVTVKGKVEKFTEGTLMVPITMVNVPENNTLKYFPKKVNVSYYVSLGNFDKVTSKDFRVVCDYEKTSENQSFLIPEVVKYPETVKNVKVAQQHIEFIITK